MTEPTSQLERGGVVVVGAVVVGQLLADLAAA
jgi:hypothetical protein